MAQPTRSDVHVNRPLTNISIAYIQEAKDFIADKVFPVVPVMKQADRYFKYDKKFWFQSQAAKRAPGTQSAGSGYHVDNTPSYYADVWAVHKDVDDQTRANADDPLNMDRDATQFVTQQLMLRREIQFMNNYMATGIWTGAADFTPSILWDAAGSVPITDIDAQKQKIKLATGYEPNTLVIARDVFTALKNNASIIDRIKYTQRGLITEELLASLIGVDKLLVINATQDSNPEGQTNSMGFLVQNMALLCYSNPAPSLMKPSAGYIFSWQGLYGAGLQGNRVKSFRMEHLESDRIEGEMAFAMNLVSSDLGIFINNPLGTP